MISSDCLWEDQCSPNAPKKMQSNQSSFFFGEFSHPGNKKKWSNLKVNSSLFSFIFYGDGLLCAWKRTKSLEFLHNVLEEWLEGYIDHHQIVQALIVQGLQNFINFIVDAEQIESIMVLLNLRIQLQTWGATVAWNPSKSFRVERSLRSFVQGKFRRETSDQSDISRTERKKERKRHPAFTRAWKHMR